MSTPENYLNRYFDPLTKSLSTEGARSILALKPDEVLVRRIVELGELSNSGQLSEEQREEYRALADAGTLISILKAKARRTLADQSA